MSTPSVSVLFISWQQKDFVAMALRALLTQTDQDFELIIGDDGSTDGTRELIEAELREYHGDIRVRLLPPGPNLGLKRNLERCAMAASGNVFIIAAGDDVSLPNRVSETAAFFREHPRCFAHYANARVTDRECRTLRARWFRHEGLRTHRFGMGERSLHQGLTFCGATASYRAELFRAFPPLLDDGEGEDNPLALRALLLGDACVGSDVLVDWCWHGANISHGARRDGADWSGRLRARAEWPRRQKRHRAAYLGDIAQVTQSGLVDLSVAERLRALVRDNYAQNTCKYHCMHPRGRWSAVFASLVRFWRDSVRSVSWKFGFSLKILAKKSLPGPLRALVLARSA